MVMGKGTLDQVAGPSLLGAGDSSGHQWLSYHLPVCETEDTITLKHLKVGGKQP